MQSAESVMIVKPGKQEQLPKSMLPAGDDEFVGHGTHPVTLLLAVVSPNVPAGQLMHALDPLICLYFPASHALHAKTAGISALVNPSLHTQSLKLVLPTEEDELSGH